MKDKIRICMFYTAIATMMLLLPFSAARADVLIIGNINISNDSLSMHEVREIFLGKQKRWDDNKEIELVILNEPDAYNKFVSIYIKRRPEQFSSWWKMQVFTGSGRLPRSFETEQEVADYVSRKKGAIGFSSSKVTKNNSIKIFNITDN